LDLYTTKQKKGKIAGLKVVIVGDIFAQPGGSLQYLGLVKLEQR